MKAALFAASIALVTSGCLTPGKPHALQYVVLPNHDEGRPTPPSAEVLKLEAQNRKDETRYPIYGDSPPPTPSEEAGTGGSGCTVGLIGSQCEHGLLSDETPLDELQLLGPDGEVIEEDLAPQDL